MGNPGRPEGGDPRRATLARDRRADRRGDRATARWSRDPRLGDRSGRALPRWLAPVLQPRHHRPRQRLLPLLGRDESRPRCVRELDDRQRARGRAGLSGRQAARYCCQATGIVGLATWMNTVGFGIRGSRDSRIPTCLASWSPLRRLHGAHDATMLSQLDEPPLERGITWSTVRLERDPQYWHVQSSRANTARRVILRLWVSRGIRT